jgi:hypothetical protein
MNMSDENLIMLTQTYGADTVAGELARELFATRVIARTACHLKNPLLEDAEVAEIVAASVDHLREGSCLEDVLASRLRILPPASGSN